MRLFTACSRQWHNAIGFEIYREYLTDYHASHNPIQLCRNCNIRFKRLEMIYNFVLSDYLKDKEYLVNLFLWHMPDDVSESVAKHSSRQQPSINLHALFTTFMFSCFDTDVLPQMDEGSVSPVHTVMWSRLTEYWYLEVCSDAIAGT